mmetsp:Transcript_7769/g.16840  ORF Transcript_7769/g.16840 Transcript_7769/m.16840 type:complete len:633 (+) Transcript_7769:84-1982(+)
MSEDRGQRRCDNHVDAGVQKRVGRELKDCEEALAASHALFRCLDGDKSGFLDRQELRRARDILLGIPSAEDHACGAAESFGDSVSFFSADLCETLSGLLQQVDENEDGVVDLNEWLEFNGAIFEVLGNRRFLSVTRRWAASLGLPTGIPTDGSKPPIVHHEALPPIPDEVVGEQLEPVIQAEHHDMPPLARRESRMSTTQSRRSVLSALPDAPGEASQDRGRCESAPSMQRSERSGSPGVDCEDSGSPPGSASRRHRGAVHPRRHRARRTSFTANRARDWAREAIEAGASPQTRPRKAESMVTLAEIFELMNSTTGGLARIDVPDVVDLVVECLECGLGEKLRDNLPQSWDPEVKPEELAVREVTELCLAVATLPLDELTEEKARAVIEEARNSQPDTHARRSLITLGHSLSAKCFRRLVELVTIMTRIDEAYLTAHFAWLVMGRFEMPDTLYMELLRTCAPRAEQDCLFTANDLSRFAYNTGIVDINEKHGLPFPVISLLYWATIRSMPENIAARHGLRNGNARKMSSAVSERNRRSSDVGLVATAPGKLCLSGKEEFTIFMEALFSALPKSSDCRCPLHMCLAFLHHARNRPASAEGGEPGEGETMGRATSVNPSRRASLPNLELPRWLN